MKNSKKLLIVESPSKIKTLKKLLNSSKENFILKATLGHIKDLPPKNLGIDFSTFEPTFLYLPSKRKILKELKKLVLKVEEIYLATDPDREGEAISYHLYEYLSQVKSSLKFFRLPLQEITELGLKEGFKNLREIDKNLYLSWKARRVSDRLIGYLISPFLSRSFKKPLSAGRVQSPALRLIVEREKEIETFIPQKSYSLIVLAEDKNGKLYELELISKKELLKKENKETLLEYFKKYFEGKTLRLFSIKDKILKKYPPYPLKTSTLIEVSGNYLSLSPKETMKIAQKLYEEGYITYMRTDSIRVSPLAKKEARAYIEKFFGKEYVGKERKIKTLAFVQDAHECIRPTQIERKKIFLSKKEEALYGLIKQFFLASQMSEAKYLERTYEFRSDTLPANLKLQMKRKKLLFDGFLALLKTEEEKLSELPDLEEGDVLKVKGCKIKEHVTKPPERYTPQSLIKKLESLGIGRPSTYATILDILWKRGYVEKEGKYLKPTELGRKVCEFLEKRTPLFMDYNFTANLENALDEIANNKKDYYSTVKEVFKVLEEYLK